MVRFDRASSPIYVYYEENDGDEPIPLYCDEGKMSGLEEISSKLKKYDVCVVFSSEAFSTKRNEERNPQTFLKRIAWFSSITS